MGESQQSETKEQQERQSQNDESRNWLLQRSPHNGLPHSRLAAAPWFHQSPVILPPSASARRNCQPLRGPLRLQELHLAATPWAKVNLSRTSSREPRTFREDADRAVAIPIKELSEGQLKSLATDFNFCPSCSTDSVIRLPERMPADTATFVFDTAVAVFLAGLPRCPSG